MTKKPPAIHPGEVLREDFLVPLRLSPLAIARIVGVPRTRIEQLVKEQTAITADTALRLAKVFGTTPAFWMGLQAQHRARRRRSRHRAQEDCASRSRYNCLRGARVTIRAIARNKTQRLQCHRVFATHGFCSSFAQRTER
jgi:addiction module HigA family antidote